jgi:hypothetical protein
MLKGRTVNTLSAKAAPAERALRRERATVVVGRSPVAFCADVDTSQGIKRPSERIMAQDRPDITLNPEFPRTLEPKYVLERCRSIDPNFKRAPFDRVRSPREAPKRRPAGWTAIYITLPKITVEGLQKVANTLAEEGQHSPWPKERRRYPRTKSHLMEPVRLWYRRSTI